MEKIFYKNITFFLRDRILGFIIHNVFMGQTEI